MTCLKIKKRIFWSVSLGFLISYFQIQASNISDTPELSSVSYSPLHISLQKEEEVETEINKKEYFKFIETAQLDSIESLLTHPSSSYKERRKGLKLITTLVANEEWLSVVSQNLSLKESPIVKDRIYNIMKKSVLLEYSQSEKPDSYYISQIFGLIASFFKERAWEFIEETNVLNDKSHVLQMKIISQARFLNPDKELLILEKMMSHDNSEDVQTMSVKAAQKLLGKFDCKEERIFSILKKALESPIFLVRNSVYEKSFLLRDKDLFHLQKIFEKEDSEFQKKIIKYLTKTEDEKTRKLKTSEFISYIKNKRELVCLQNRSDSEKEAILLSMIQVSFEKKDSKTQEQDLLSILNLELKTKKSQKLAWEIAKRTIDKETSGWSSFFEYNKARAIRNLGLQIMKKLFQQIPLMRTFDYDLEESEMKKLIEDIRFHINK